jgi:pimeloyl-ACP methyl ester carboxylesterase
MIVARTGAGIATALAVAALLGACLPSPWGVTALLHPVRRPVTSRPALPHRDLEVDSGGVKLKGWYFPAELPVQPRVTVVFLHGLSENRESGTWIAEKLVPVGFDVAVFDSRAHGDSGGDTCTYGYFEKRDLSRILDQLGAARVVLVGASLGAAVALQEAPDDPRVVAVVASGGFSDLETIARERLGRLATGAQVGEMLAAAEREGRFEVAKVSPLEAARRIQVPVLVVHGDDDPKISFQHSRRIYDALPGPKRLRLVAGGSHGDTLARAWPEIGHWIDVVSGVLVR